MPCLRPSTKEAPMRTTRVVFMSGLGLRAFLVGNVPFSEGCPFILHSLCIRLCTICSL